MNNGPEIQRVVAFADTLRPFLGFHTVVRRYPLRVCRTNNPYSTARPKPHKDYETGVAIFSNGRMIVSRHSTEEAARDALDTMARKVGVDQAHNFRVANIISAWNNASAIPEGAYVPANVPGVPNACVLVSDNGRVVCTGPTTMAEVDLIYAMYQ